MDSITHGFDFLIIAQESGTNQYIGITNIDFRLIRFRPAIGWKDRATGTKLNSNNRNQVDHIIEYVENSSEFEIYFSEIVSCISELIKINPEKHLEFYQRAGPLNLKRHAFQMLPSVGRSRALEMQESRLSGDWSNFSEIAKDVRFNPEEALAHRYAEEILDLTLKPRLLELLVRVNISLEEPISEPPSK